MTDTLADALTREIARVTAKKERWQGYMRDYDMGLGIQLTINIMQAEIETAVKACASGDVTEMMASLENLRGYNDEDSVTFDDGWIASEHYEMADAAPVEMSGAPLQDRVSGWMQDCFGPEISADRLVRGDRLLEEVFELLQSGDYPRERVAALREYVWNRPKGEPEQEVGGVMLTLAAYCLAHEINMHEAGEREIDRVTQPEVVLKIRAKQAAKPTGSALPIAATEPAHSVREAARLLLDALNEELELDDVIQTAMQEEADMDGTDEWVFVLCAGLRAIAERKDDE